MIFTGALKAVDRHAPIKKLSRKELKLDSKPWIPPVIVKLIKYRNTLFSRKKGNLTTQILKGFTIYLEIG